MNWIVMAVAAAVMAACSHRAAVEDSKDGNLDTMSVVHRVNDIYEGVFDYYGKVFITSTLSSLDNIDSLYCSADWNAWVSRVHDFDCKHEDDGMMGFFDADYWIMGQDWQDLSISDIRVIDLTDLAATVELNLHNCGSTIPVRLEMVMEDGLWRIDNFIDIKYDLNWKASMKEYLAEKNVNQ